MKKKYVPELVHKKGWKGHIVIDLFPMEKYLELQAEIAEMRKEKLAAGDDEGQFYLKKITKLIDATKSRYLEVELQSPDGEVVKSFEDLSNCGYEGVSTMTEIAMGMLNGFDQGNSVAP